MKKIWGIILVIILVVSLDFMTEKHTTDTVNDINSKLKKLNHDIEENYIDSEFVVDDTTSKNLIKSSKEILELWREKDKMLSFYIEHDEVEKVSQKINSFNKQIETNNYTDAVVSIIETEFLLGHITEKQSLNLKNIF